MYKIPLFQLNYNEEEERAVLDVLRSKWISSGPQCQALEEKLQDMLGVKRALALSNCTAALHLAVLAAGVQPGDEVIVPSLTFVATVNAVRYAGATPIFCDITSTEQLTIDPEKIERAITRHTKAIVVMHYGGFPCEMDAVLRLAKERNIMVIEDACHGPLSEYHRKKLGTIGDVGCFSFFSNKNVSTGEGGALVTNNDAIYERVKLLRSHGMTTMSYERANGHATVYDVMELGYNYRLDDIRSSLAIAQLKKLEADIAKREKVRERYIEQLAGVEGLIIPFRTFKEQSSSYIFPVVLGDRTRALKNNGGERRDAVRAELAVKGIETSVHYPAVHRFAIYRTFCVSPLPVTEYVTDHELTLPMYGSLTGTEIDYICNSLKEVLARYYRDCKHDKS